MGAKAAQNQVVGQNQHARKSGTHPERPAGPPSGFCVLMGMGQSAATRRATAGGQGRRATQGQMLGFGVGLLDALQRHPFPVVAHFDRVVAVSFAFPEEALRSLVPAPLEMDTFGPFGFLTVALVWTRNLRPAGLPRFLGRDFFLAGYRVFVRLRDPDGRRLRGLKILGSDTDKAFMVRAGNGLTRYRYRRVRVEMEERDAITRVRTTAIDGTTQLEIDFEQADEGIEVPAGSPFADWGEARRFAGPMPFTFSPEVDGSVVVIEGARQNWIPRPVRVNHWRVALFEEEPLRAYRPILANAFAVRDIPYRWKRGRVIRPGGQA